jgi:predicted DNA-binding transcriptional regulator AlpA
MDSQNTPDSPETSGEDTVTLSRLVTVPELVDWWNISESVAYRLSKEIPRYKFGKRGTIRHRREDVEAYMASRLEDPEGGAIRAPAPSKAEKLEKLLT